MDWESVQGVVTRGHRVASGACGDPRFPLGTIAPQLPFFRAALPDFEGWLGGVAHPGTINLAVAGSVEPLAPEFVVPGVAWTDVFPPENFFLSRCLIETGGERRPGFLYIPDPATKPDHPQRGDIVEVLAGFVPNIAYGDRVTLHYPPGAIAIRAG